LIVNVSVKKKRRFQFCFDIVVKEASDIIIAHLKNGELK